MLLFHTESSTKYGKPGLYWVNHFTTICEEHFFQECSLFFFEKQEGVSLSQAGVPYAISGTTINITGYSSGKGTVSVTAPAGGSWSIDFASNAFSLNASPSSGTGSNSSVTINAINDSGQTGIHRIDIYLKNGSTVVDTATVQVRITSQG